MWFFIPNREFDEECRINQLLRLIKMVGLKSQRGYRKTRAHSEISAVSFKYFRLVVYPACSNQDVGD